ncbi:MAG: chromate transporter [Muribaculaceae bacterium]
MAATPGTPAGVAPVSSSLTDMFVTFLKIGAFTFGGGWAMISIIEREVVKRHQWLDKEAFLDLLAVSQSLPGILAVNIAVAVGDKIRGRAGCYACAAGTILPSFLIILAIAIFLTPEAITGNEHLSAIFKGIRPAVVALIIAPVLNAAKAAHLNMVTVWIPAIVALAIWSSIPVISNPILWIVLAIVVGIAHLKGYFKRNRKGGDAQ